MESPNSRLQKGFIEQKIYDRFCLQQDAGQIPRYYAAVEEVCELPTLLKDVAEDKLAVMRRKFGDYLRIPAAILSFVKGRPLAHFRHFLPRRHWRTAFAAVTSLVTSAERMVS